MAIATDFDIQNDKDIRYTGSTANYTVLAFHQWLRDNADNATPATSDDFLDITRPTPSEKSFDTIINLINGFNIDDTAAQHLYGGSIIQAGGAEIYDGIQVLAPAGMRLEVIQNGALVNPNFWTTGLNADTPNGISHQFMLKVRTSGADIDGRRLLGTSREWGKTFLEFKINGTARGVNVMAFTGWGDDLNNTTDVSTIAGYTTIVNMDEGYVLQDVNGDTTNEAYYSQWDRTTSYSINTFYERMKWLTRRGSASTVYGLNGDLFRGITHEINVDTKTGTSFVEPESLTWTETSISSSGQLLATDSVSAPTKLWIQITTGIPPTDGTVITGTSGGSHTVTVNVTVTERSVSTPFCGQSTGTSIIGAYGFALQITPDLTSADKLTALDNAVYQTPNYQYFSVGGLVSPSEDYVLVGPRGYRFFYDGETSGPFTVGETLTFTSPAGTAKLADLLDLGATGEMFIGPMLTGAAPTDNSPIAGATATAAVNGTVYDDINVRQLTLNGALSGGAVVSVVVNEAIPTDTPSTGTIRIKRASGKYTRHPYSVWNGGTKTFTITSHDFSGDNAPNGAQVFISYLDLQATTTPEQFQVIYSTPRSLFIRVRNGGVTNPIKTFETTGTLGSAGGSTTAVRTSDA